MKKFISIAVALVMMMAIAVPAFAAVQYEDGTAGTQTVINTLLVREDGTSPEFYTVTIPATQTIYWEADETDISYTINSQLETGKRVKVSVADADAQYLMTKEGSTYSISYDIIDKEYTASAAVVVDEADTVTIDTSAASWASVAVDSYTDTLTFTAKVI